MGKGVKCSNRNCKNVSNNENDTYIPDLSRFNTDERYCSFDCADEEALEKEAEGYEPQES